MVIIFLYKFQQSAVHAIHQLGNAEPIETTTYISS